MCIDNSSTSFTLDGKLINLGLWDTAGAADYDRLRPLSYPRTDVFIVCFSVSSPSSLHRVKSFWVPEISHHCPSTPFLLVATKLDLRDDQSTNTALSENGEAPVCVAQGEDMAKEVGAVGYCECSALTRHGIDEVFETAIRSVISTGNSA
eukprot:CAMPEP_0174266242 /NCGR_PEP_ID=MMETSP0439-20130205/29504_1 /TAXON_ID=0 /ORGANISM="Stereomyxa ramosa, Strain Chinc5" /LENGTH=149 /DNA_ID=CAMNT_0015353091 /DNA_START=95 /DNA_END=541 /DNA_ORIENTATION=+